MDWLKRNWNTVAGLLGVFGVVFGVWAYFNTVKERIPTFYVEPTRSIIVNASGSSVQDLTIAYQGQEVRNASVVAIQVYFWNKGKEPIKAIDVLRPLRISMPSGCRILRTQIVAVSRDVSNFSLQQDEVLHRSVDVRFDIAELGAGARIQLIYAGDPNATPTVTGTVVGAASPTVKRSGASEDLVLVLPARWKRFERRVLLLFFTLAIGSMIWL